MQPGAGRRHGAYQDIDLGDNTVKPWIVLRRSSASVFVSAVCFLSLPSPAIFADAADASICAAAIGLTPQSIAACGLQSQASTVLQQLINAADERQALDSAISALHSASTNATALAALSAQSPEDASLAPQLAAAQEQVVLARTQLAGAQDALFAVAVEGLSQPQLGPLVHWRQNVGRQAPLEFRVIERSPEQWKAIEQAIIAERRAIRRGTPLDQERAAILEAIRDEAVVGTAAAGLASNLAAVQGIFAEFGIGSAANAD